MALLVIEAKNQLPVVLRAAGDAIRAHRARAEPRRGLDDARDGEPQHAEHDQQCPGREQPTDHALCSRVSLLCSDASG